jgi:CheY-like chemotaxis protein
MMIAASDWVELVKLAPSILWVGFALLVVLLFRSAIAERLPALRSLELPGGVKAQFDAALTQAAASTGTTIPSGERTRLERRVARDASLLRGSRLLWIDDEPASTRTERSAMTALGVVIDTATSDDDARRRIAAEQYDVIISDIARGERSKAGLAFISDIREHDKSVPIIFYIRNLSPDLGTPASAHGLTNRPDELVDLLLDALERRRI